jgi:hypothetical protein
MTRLFDTANRFAWGEHSAAFGRICGSARLVHDEAGQQICGSGSVWPKDLWLRAEWVEVFVVCQPD